LLGQFLQQDLRITMDLHIRENGWLLQFVRIDIDRDLVSGSRKGFVQVGDLPDTESRAEREEQIRVLNNEVAGPVARHTGPAEK
jgi:hypothetical protein